MEFTTKDLSKKIIEIICKSRGFSNHKNFGMAISIFHFHLLNYLKEKKQATMSDISEYLKISLPSTNEIINHLQANGLINRECLKTDRRHIIVTLTKKGVESLANEQKKIFIEMSKRIERLTLSEQKLLARAADILIKKII